jgi:hypothetical protein
MYSARSALWADLSEHQLVEKDVCLALRYCICKLGDRHFKRKRSKIEENAKLVIIMKCCCRYIPVAGMLIN